LFIISSGNFIGTYVVQLICSRLTNLSSLNISGMMFENVVDRFSLIPLTTTLLRVKQLRCLKRKPIPESILKTNDAKQIQEYLRDQFPELTRFRN
jgi:hypothetical protein